MRSNRPVNVPVVIQMEAVECGAAALAMVLAYYGHYEPLEKVRVQCGVSRDGSNAKYLMLAAQHYGLNCKAFRISDSADLEQHPKPSIIFWNFNHFVVYCGRKGKTFFLNDPASGSVQVSEEEFEASFTGITLTFTRGDNFKPQGNKKSTVSSLRRRLSGAYSSLAFAFLAGFLLLIPGLMTTGFQKGFLDQILGKNMSQWMYPMLFIMAGTLCLQLLLGLLQQFALLKTNLYLSVSSSGKFLLHVLSLPIEFFNQRYPGEIASRVALNDRVADLLSDQLATNLISAATVFLYLIVMFVYDVPLTLLALSIMVVNLVMIRVVSRRRVVLNKTIKQENGKLVGIGMSGLQLIETLKAGGRENDFFSSWAGYQAKLFNSEQQLDRSSAIVATVPTLLNSINSTSILIVGALRILAGDLSVGMLLAYQTLSAMFAAPFNGIVNFGSQLQEIDADLERIDDVFNYSTGSERTQTAAGPLHRGKLKGRIEMKNITFGYSKVLEPILKDFNLTLEPGDRVALVGGSGSGKSTVAKLLVGIYQPWSGEILFDGMRREEIDPLAMAGSMSMVDQDIFLFQGPLIDNITMWDRTIPLDTVIQAGKDAEIHNEITKRPGSYNSLVEENGANFSGGQAQRLEIARALASNPSLLILDEATSALDPMTEMRIDQAVRRRGCTTLIVAHRLSTIRDCNTILVLDKGNIMEQGSHEELMALEGAYCALIKA